MPGLRRNKPANQGAAGYGVDKKQAADIKQFNKTAVYVQGFRTTLSATGLTPVTVNLNAPGRRLLGISVFPGSGVNADIADCQLTLIVNNNNVILNMAALNADQGFVHANAYYLPTPQPLSGNDTITVNITKNSGAGTPVVYVNVFYIPR